MTQPKYWTMLTPSGRAKIKNAIGTGQQVNITHFAVGDGDILENATGLVNERYRGLINSSTVDSGNDALIEILGVVPSTTGGFYVREAAFIADDGVPFAIVKYPETFKPAVEDNASAELGIKAVIDVLQASAVSLKIDPSMVYATQDWTGKEIAKIGPHDVGALPGAWRVVDNTSDNQAGWYKIATFDVSGSARRGAIWLTGAKGYGDGDSYTAAGATIFLTDGNNTPARDDRLNAQVFVQGASNSVVVKDVQTVDNDDDTTDLYVQLDVYQGLECLYFGDASLIKARHAGVKQDPVGGRGKPIFTHYHTGNLTPQDIDAAPAPMMSGRNFDDGTLVVTDIDFPDSPGDAWYMEISGNSYGDRTPWDVRCQGYMYSGDTINSGGISNGRQISGLCLFKRYGKLNFWWPRQGYWHGFNVMVTSVMPGKLKNRVVSIQNSIKPPDSEITKYHELEIKRSYSEAHKPSPEEIGIRKFYQNPGDWLFVRQAQITEIARWDSNPATYTLDESTFNIGDKFIVNRMFAETGQIKVITDNGVIITPDNVNAGSFVTMSDMPFRAEFTKSNQGVWHLQVFPTGKA